MKYVIIIFSLILGACSTTKQFTKGEYNDPTEVKLLDDKFNESDLQQITKTMTIALKDCFEKENIKTVLFAGISNQTAEHLSTEMIKETILVGTHDQVRYINKPLREELAQEYSYEASGMVRTPAAIDHKSPEVIVMGKIFTNIQEVGRDKTVYYLFSLNVTDFSTNQILCAQTKELRKIFRKQSVE